MSFIESRYVSSLSSVAVNVLVGPMRQFAGRDGRGCFHREKGAGDENRRRRVVVD